MSRSKEIFMDQREDETINSLPMNWIDPIDYPWRNDKSKIRVGSSRVRMDDPVAEHDEREWKAAVDRRIE